MNTYKGRCLCGECRYVISGQPPKAMYLCHCNRCRKQTGTIHCANIFFADAHLKWESGEHNITHYVLAGTRKQSTFCKICGSQLPKQFGKTQVILPAGSLDTEDNIEPTAHIFYQSRASWEDKIHVIQKFDELPE